MSVEAVVSLGALGRLVAPRFSASAATARSNFFLRWSCCGASIRHLAETVRSGRRQELQADCSLFSLHLLSRFCSDAARAVEARPSPIGIVLLILAAVVMPWLAKQKRRLSAVTGSAALRADAAESTLCGYLALIALAGLARQCGLGSELGRPGRCTGSLALDSARGMGSNEGKAMLWCMLSPRSWLIFTCVILSRIPVDKSAYHQLFSASCKQMNSIFSIPEGYKLNCESGSSKVSQPAPYDVSDRAKW